MTFLPIVERELRVAARRRGTYGTRLKIAGIASLFFAFCFVAGEITPAFIFGKALFLSLAGFCMAFCLAAGRLMTADCLSKEKREGTLGLLFLTDLNGFDVVLGKMAATSLDGFYGLLAVFPMMAVPLLTGGMTNGELWRMMLTLINTFLFSLAVGIFVSAASRDQQKAMGANFGLLLSLTGALPAMGAFLFALADGAKPFHEKLLYSCPVYTFMQCEDGRYSKSPGHFWWSLGITFGLTLLLVLLACVAAPRSWQDKPVAPCARKSKAAPRRRWWRQGKVEVAKAFRKRLLDVNAYFWLAARPYVKTSYVWTAMFLIGCAWAMSTVMIGRLDDTANFGYAFILNALLKMWITTEAGHQLAEDKRSGAFELLLCTPLTARDILRGQWLSLRRQFLKPMVVALAVEALLLISVRQLRRDDETQARWIWLAGIIVFLADVITIGWFAMASALTEKSHAWATAKTAGLIMAAPWILFGAVAGLTRLWVFLFFLNDWDPPWRYDLGWWFWLSIAMDVLLLIQARKQLHSSFRQFALAAPLPSLFARLSSALKEGLEGQPAARARLRRVAVAILVALLAGAGGIRYAIRSLQVSPPDPVVVSLNQNKHPPQVFNTSGGFLFIMPDGSLWRWARAGWQKGSAVTQPERLGTNRDWLQASAASTNAVGVRSDGSLWTWNTGKKAAPRQIGSEHDWVDSHAAYMFAIALKRDGTLWAWGDNSVDQLGNGPGPNRSEPVQVGTNHDWTAVNNFPWGNIMALRADGSLWTWGGYSYAKWGSWGSFTTNVWPIQACKESDWAGFTSIGARNQAGASWTFMPPAGLPGPDVPIRSISVLATSNATTVCYGLMHTTNWTEVVYETRPDGTLWATPFTWPLTGQPTEPPVRIGVRTDWVSVWGNAGTVIGLTSDGTLWTWGLDCSQEQHLDFEDRLAVIKERLADALGSPQSSRLGMNTEEVFQGYRAQKEPRPLFRFVGAKK